MDDEIVFFFSINDVDGFATANKHTFIAYLATAFTVEGCSVKDDVKYLSTFRCRGSVFSNFGLVDHTCIVTYEFAVRVVEQFDPVTYFLLSISARSCFLFTKGSLKTGLVDSPSFFQGNKFGKVDGKTVGIVKFEGSFSVNLRIRKYASRSS